LPFLLLLTEIISRSFHPNVGSGLSRKLRYSWFVFGLCRQRRTFVMERFSLLIAATALAASLSCSVSAQAGGRCCYGPDCTRGVAIMSPLESPDPCDSPVGGAYRYTPYYRGFAIDRNCMPPLYGTISTHGVPQPTWRAGLGQRAVPYASGSYGSFSGGSQDETNLLRLGGFGLAGNGSYRPYHGSSGDVIDRIQGR
jgi:hypothetical protein